MNKLMESVSRCYEACIEASIPAPIAIFACAFFVIIGLVIGFGIHYLMSWCFMYVYNILAQTFNWPIFPIWFWFVGLYVIDWLKRIIFPNNIKEEE